MVDCIVVKLGYLSVEAICFPSALMHSLGHGCFDSWPKKIEGEVKIRTRTSLVYRTAGIAGQTDLDDVRQIERKAKYSGLGPGAWAWALQSNFRGGSKVTPPTGGGGIEFIRCQVYVQERLGAWSRTLGCLLDDFPCSCLRRVVDLKTALFWMTKSRI